MTAIAWAIIIALVCLDPSLKEAPEQIKNMAYGMATIGLIFIFLLTLKELIK